MTISKTLFRWLVVMSFGMGIVYVYVAVITEASLPEPLQNYISVANDSAGELSIFTLILFVVVVVTYVGLYFFWWAAPFLMLATTIAFWIYLGVSPPTVESGLASALGEIGTLAEGIILAIVFLTPARDWFKAKSKVE